MRLFIFSFLFLGNLVWAQQPVEAKAPSPAPVSNQAPVVEPALVVPPMGTMDVLTNDEGIEFQPTGNYMYDPSNRRDPFRPFGYVEPVEAPPVAAPKFGEKKNDPAKLETNDPLQMFDVTQFKLMGIIWQVKNPKAILKDPLGKQHLVFKNTKLGRNNGFVAAIREGEVLVVEPVVTENGMTTAITKSISLKK